MEISNSHSKPEEQHGDNQFNRLPDDLFIFILTKIRQQDFKFLFRCSLISKHFAASILLMPSVSISISPPNFRKFSSSCSKSSLQDVADRFIDRKMDYLTSLRPQIQNALLFLKKFEAIRSIDVVFITDDDDEHKEEEERFRYGFLPSLVNWKTKFDFKLQSFVFLFAQSVTTKSDQNENELEDIIDDVIDDVTPEELELRLYSSFHGVVDSIEWGNVMSCLLVQHPFLREITIAGSGNSSGENSGENSGVRKPATKGGKICLTNQQIVNLRNSLSPEDVATIKGNCNGNGNENGNGIGVTINVKSAYIPALRVPTTGYDMRSVSLVVVRVGRRLYQPGEEGFRSDSDDGDSSDEEGEEGEVEEYDDGDILKWEFEAGEEVFREAVSLILIHHKDKLKRET